MGNIEDILKLIEIYESPNSDKTAKDRALKDIRNGLNNLSGEIVKHKGRVRDEEEFYEMYNYYLEDQ